jgi:hypothetical protein
MPGAARRATDAVRRRCGRGRRFRASRRRGRPLFGGGRGRAGLGGRTLRLGRGRGADFGRGGAFGLLAAFRLPAASLGFRGARGFLGAALGSRRSCCSRAASRARWRAAISLLDRLPSAAGGAGRAGAAGAAGAAGRGRATSNTAGALTVGGARRRIHAAALGLDHHGLGAAVAEALLRPCRRSPRRRGASGSGAPARGRPGCRSRRSSARRNPRPSASVTNPKPKGAARILAPPLVAPVLRKARPLGRPILGDDPAKPRELADLLGPSLGPSPRKQGLGVSHFPVPRPNAIPRR